MFWNRSVEKNKTMELIERYVAETGQRFFTYQDMRAWYYGSGVYREYHRDWHTIERMLRKLAEDGHLLRYKYKRTVMFVVPAGSVTSSRLEKWKEKYRRYMAEGDYYSAENLVKFIAEELKIPEHMAFKLLKGGEKK